MMCFTSTTNAANTPGTTYYVKFAYFKDELSFQVNKPCFHQLYYIAYTHHIIKLYKFIKRTAQC